MVVFCLTELSLNLCYLVEADGDFGQAVEFYIEMLEVAVT